ncbi:DNA polymerase-3 subunit epsilon [Catalinimonas alkaloidigena]|uniref:DNA polymerase-3 subunit epsilon n=1 Tax=Catalinimonas alkaloidigena TaxID=1075417 RepID=A0A1G9AQU0_9BACT|nr:exonuclease domain-containing protein [Catalinimonas alkaloidigena]SDK29648.1 DNA polymerase-3 subunit epsilon [Catalinimonas alkaloidigena]
MRFIALDFETANYRRDSICEIGLSRVEEGRVVETRSWRIRPEPNYFNWQNIQVHGITARDVEQSPTFAALWPELVPYFQDTYLVAHNASFDISVLRHGLMQYEIPFPTFHYACSVQIARRTWKGLTSYGLGSLSQWLGIDLNHHAAGSDARASALIALRAFEKHGIDDFQQLPAHLGLRLGRVFPGGYTATGKAAAPPKRLPVAPARAIAGPERSAVEKPDHPFFSKTIVFTGRFLSMPRARAQHAVEEIGGVCSNQVTTETHFLVIGQKEFVAMKEGQMSAKLREAQRLRHYGSSIEFVSESHFLELIR